MLEIGPNNGCLQTLLTFLLSSQVIIVTSGKIRIHFRLSLSINGLKLVWLPLVCFVCLLHNPGLFQPGIVSLMVLLFFIGTDIQNHLGLFYVGRCSLGIRQESLFGSLEGIFDRLWLGCRRLHQ